MFIPIMASRLMLSLKKAADGPYTAMHTEDPSGVATDVLFAQRYHATMEYAMEARLSSRRGDREQTIDLELENLSS